MASPEKTVARNDGGQTSAAPSISLSKGGGAIRGMGEKFAANPVTGTGSMTVPIATSPGRSGFGPQLSLSYDSGAGNGPYGFGWSLSLPLITRKTDKGLPHYRDAEESDVFILSGAEDLVPVLDADGTRWSEARRIAGIEYRVHRYRPRIEGLFARIERWTNVTTGESHWRSLSRDNILTLYGQDEISRIADPEDARRVFSWLICETRDDTGNAVIYQYQAEDGTGVDFAQAHERNRGDRDDSQRTANRYLKRIRYGNRTPLLDNAGHRPLALPPVQRDNASWMFEVVFDYGEHPAADPKPNDAGDWRCRHDPFSTYRAGFEVRTYRLCRRVLMFHHFPEEVGVGQDCLVRSTNFTFRETPIAAFIAAVTQNGYKRVEAGGYLVQSLPPLEFEYSAAAIGQEIHDVDPTSLENLPYGVDGAAYQWVDLDGEGLSGILTEQGSGWFYKRNESAITRDKATEAYSARFAPVEHIAGKPAGNPLTEGRLQFLDLAGDGQVDLVQLDRPVAGFYERTDAQDWDHFRPFSTIPNLAWNDPNLRFIDLTGDGHADVLITEDQALTWYPSLAEDGFGAATRVNVPTDEERGPHVVFADGTQTIFLADLSGDGLTDIARIRNGEVCYWPNLGYGRFGAKVTMDDAPWFDPPEQFDPRRIRLADIDGSGVTDIIYLGRNQTRFWFNQSGNAWSTAHELPGFPAVDSMASMAAVDLLGNGTACLVWSSPLPGASRAPMKYLNLMAEGKPHLLVRTRNNLGAETQVRYTPSTYFYLRDLYDGKPWITKLPFPVHVVERVETYDHISRNRFVTRYAYHHGYFDGVEREFRGFGMVEQTDTEEFGALTADGRPPAANEDAASHVPPVLTRSWFHTGVYLGRERVSNFFAGLADEADRGEYYREPSHGNEQAKLLLLEDTILPTGLTLDEERQAARSHKGMMLRQEVYALDGVGVDENHPFGHPYTVTEQNFAVRLLQPAPVGSEADPELSAAASKDAHRRHAVFFTHPREALTIHYEREPNDPRAQHALTLEVDAFGNVLKTAAIGYGRRAVDPDLPTDADRLKQTTVLLTYTENHVTNPVDDLDVFPADYRTPLPAETRTYELTGYTPTGAAGRFRQADFVAPDPGDPEGLRRIPIFDDEIPYEAKPTNAKQRRLIEHIRSLYRKDDLTALLPPGEMEPLALPGESYKLAFTPGLLAQVYKRKIGAGPEENLLPDAAQVLGGKGGDQGGYVDLDGNGNWWIPSGRLFFNTTADAADPAVTAAAELAEARQHFFSPRKLTDPFAHSSTVDYDPHDLLVVRTEDAAQNTVTARHDYRVLQPRQITDPNGNWSEARFDVLGLVVGTAVMGKNGEGDSFATFTTDLTPQQIKDYFDAANPRTLSIEHLGTATTRILYDLERIPACAASIARETHVSELAEGEQSKVQLSFVYSDGFGREAQTKIQAEPGPLEPSDPGSPLLDPRWVGTGTMIYNNKGKPVRQYEPFFSLSHHFRIEQHGVSSTLFYDPVERVVATLHPNHTWEKVVFDPWRQEAYDVNDTMLQVDPKADADVGDFFRRLPDAEYLPTWHVLRTDPTHAAEFAEQYPNAVARTEETEAATKTQAHAGTPSVAHFDVLGRPNLAVAHNQFLDGGNTIDEKYEMRTELDIEGNTRAVVDHLGRAVMRYDYDLLSTVIHTGSMDAGERWMLGDVAGNPIRAWDSHGHTFRKTYDELRRPLQAFVAGTDPQNPAAELLSQATIYGESVADAAQELNLRGRAVMQFEAAGVVVSAAENPDTNTVEAYDFKGNLLRSTRRLAREYRQAVDWNAADWNTVEAALAAGPFVPEDVLTPLLEPQAFRASTTFDALNRPISLTTPDASEILPTYNEANLLEQVTVRLHGATTTTPFVNDIDYDAKGQRERIEYGNGVVTEYEYNEETFRLIHLKTTRQTGVNPLQDLHYTYDPAGNITRIRDAAQQAIYFDNAVVEPHADYIYDALYRLIEAEGREHIGQTSNNLPEHHPEKPHYDFNDSTRRNLPHPNDGQAMRRYTERYKYDAVGNILSMIHQASGGSWTRHYAYATDSNRMLSTSLPGDPEDAPYSAKYEYDIHGNMTKMPHLPLMAWDYRDQLQATSTQVVTNGGTPEITYYVYDAAGQRVRKVTERQAAAGQTPTRKDERIYLGGFEIYRKYQNDGDTVKLQRETLHIMDDAQRIALVETRTQGIEPERPEQLIRYQFGNHLGSASLELDGQSQIISYEEYYAYGSTSYQAGRSVAEVSLKRYRYTGMERDEENGLNYQAARYYIPYLGRWLSADRIGVGDGLNLFSYSAQDPIGKSDTNGFETNKEWADRHTRKVREAIERSDTNHDRHITLKEFYAGFMCSTLSAADYQVFGEKAGAGFTFDPALGEMLKPPSPTPGMGGDNTPRTRTDAYGRQIGSWSDTEGRAITKKQLNRHRDPQRVIVTAKTAAMVLVPEYYFAVSSIYHSAQGKPKEAAADLAGALIGRYIKAAGKPPPKPTSPPPPRPPTGEPTILKGEPAGSPSPAAAVTQTASAEGAAQWNLSELMIGAPYKPTQRTIYRGTVEKMSEAMRGGTFNWSGMEDPIIVSTRGEVLQGHHRIVAARLAGKPIPPSALKTVSDPAGRDPRPWGSVTLKPGERPH